MNKSIVLITFALVLSSCVNDKSEVESKEDKAKQEEINRRQKFIEKGEKFIRINFNKTMDSKTDRTGPKPVISDFTYDTVMPLTQASIDKLLKEFEEHEDKRKQVKKLIELESSIALKEEDYKRVRKEWQSKLIAPEERWKMESIEKELNILKEERDNLQQVVQYNKGGDEIEEMLKYRSFQLGTDTIGFAAFYRMNIEGEDGSKLKYPMNMNHIPVFFDKNFEVRSEWNKLWYNIK